MAWRTPTAEHHHAELEQLRAMAMFSSQSMGSLARAHAPAAANPPLHTGGPTPCSVTGDATFLQLQPPQQQGLGWLLVSADQALLVQAHAAAHYQPSSRLVTAISLPASTNYSNNGLLELMEGTSLTSPDGLPSPFAHTTMAGGQMPSTAMRPSSAAAAWDLLAGVNPSACMTGGPPVLVAAEESGSLYVSGLPPGTTELLLYQTFSKFGALHSCKIKIDPTTGLCSGVAFVNYVNCADAQLAKHLTHCTTIPGGWQMLVKLQPPRKVRAAAAATQAIATMLRRS